MDATDLMKKPPENLLRRKLRAIADRNRHATGIKPQTKEYLHAQSLQQPLTREEENRLKAVFKWMDIDGDKSITIDEIFTAMTGEGMFVRMDEVKKMLYLIDDTHKRTGLTLDDFKELYVRCKADQTGAEPKELYNFILYAMINKIARNSDHDGDIAMDEMYEYLADVTEKPIAMKVMTALFGKKWQAERFEHASDAPSIRGREFCRVLQSHLGSSECWPWMPIRTMDPTCGKLKKQYEKKFYSIFDQMKTELDQSEVIAVQLGLRKDPNVKDDIEMPDIWKSASGLKHFEMLRQLKEDKKIQREKRRKEREHKKKLKEFEMKRKRNLAEREKQRLMVLQSKQMANPGNSKNNSKMNSPMGGNNLDGGLR